MIAYAAFLRGINSGANPTTKMSVLRTAFEGMGFQNVSTVIASGNVLFDAKSNNESELERRIEQSLPSAIGFQSVAIVYALDDLQSLAKRNPFIDVEATADASQYVTFLKSPPKSPPKLSGKGFKILGMSRRAVFSIVDLSTAKTPDLMRLLDKEFGKTHTTRSWRTIQRIFRSREA